MSNLAMAAQPSDPIDETTAVDGGLPVLQEAPCNIKAVLESLRQDALYEIFTEHFLKAGRGRRPSIPLLKSPTIRILLLLYCIKEDSHSTWDTVTSWFCKLFPEVDCSRGRLEYKIKMLVKTAESEPLNSLFLESPTPIDFTVLPKPLSELGFSRGGLLHGLFPSNVMVNNSLVCALDIFRSKEGLSQAFLYKCLLKLCPGHTESQMRHKISVILKKAKELKRKKHVEDLESYLAEPLQISVSVVKNAVQIPKTNLGCRCKQLQKENQTLENNIKSANFKQEDLTVQVSVLKEERENLLCFKKAADLFKPCNCNRRIKELEQSLTNVHQSKLYKNNENLKGELRNYNHMVVQKDEQIKCLKEMLVMMEKKIACLNVKVKSEQTLKSNYKKKNEYQKQVSESYEYLLKTENEEIVTRDGRFNKFSPDVRLTVMQLQGEANVAARNCSKVIEIVASNIFGQHFKAKDLPCASSSMNIADEAHHVAKVQIADEIHRSQYFTFGSDGTSRQKKHYMENHIYLDNGKILSLGFQEIATDDAQTLLEKTVGILEELSEVYSENEQNKETIFKEVLSKMQCLMSDRAANMKLFNRKFAELKNSIIDEDLGTHFLFCNAHFLLGLATALEKSLKDVESPYGKLGRDQFGEFIRFSGSKEPAALRFIRTSAEVFGPRGDEKSGCRQDWLAFCETQNVLSHFSSHRGNRFNNLFENASAAVFHRTHILDFLSNNASPNLKLRSILKDLQDNTLLSIVSAIAAFNALLSLPYWKLMNSTTSYGAFPPYVKAMDDILGSWIIEEEFSNSYHEYFSNFFEPDQATSVFINSLSDTDRTVMHRAFQDISKKSREVLRRQLSDFLDGGIFGGIIPDEVMVILNTCPLTNLVGERMFGDLDYDMSKRRYCSTHHRSTINMWKHNYTAHWIKRKSAKDRKKILEMASLKGSSLRQKHKASDLEVKEKIKRRLAKNYEIRQQKLIRERELKAAILENILSSGGVCNSKMELDELYQTGTLKDLRAQIRYRRLFLGEKGLKVSGNRKVIYQRLLSHIEKT